MFFLHRNKSISRVINRWCQEKTLDINSGINDYVTSNNWKILKLGKSTFSGFYNTFRESNLFDDHAFFCWSLQCDFFSLQFWDIACLKYEQKTCFDQTDLNVAKHSRSRRLLFLFVHCYWNSYWDDALMAEF